MTIAATLLCQLGMALTCLPAGSVMHMPTIKNTILVGVVAFAMAVGLDLLTEHVLDYGPLTANSLQLIAIFLFAVSVFSFFHPVIADDGRIAYRYPTLAVMGFAELTVILFSKKVKPAFKLPKINWKEPGNVFVAMASLLGVALCIVLPHETVIGYDDESHYKNTLITSQGLYTVTDDADVRLFYWFWDHDLGFTSEERAASDEALNTSRNNGSLYLESNTDAYDIRRTGYIAPAAGIWLGNALNLKAGATFTLGRIANVLMYSFIMGLAIKRLKSGKMVLFTLGMCPYLVISAACYSYDAWTMAFLSLGLATLFTVLQKNEPADGREFALMLGALTLGCMPKAPYAPMLLLPLFLPSRCFENKIRRRRIIWAVIAILFVIALLTYAASFGAADPVDERGNVDSTVSGYAQLAYIVSKPFEYAGTLFSFLFDGYLFSHQYLGGTVYLGFAEVSTLILAAAALAALTDNGEISCRDVGIRAAGLLICLLSIMAVATAMYLVFTPAGAATVHGCQERYMVFLLFPAIMFLLNGWIKTKPGRLYYAAFYVFSAAVLAYSLYELIILPGL